MWLDAARSVSEGGEADWYAALEEHRIPTRKHGVFSVCRRELQEAFAQVCRLVVEAGEGSQLLDGAMGMFFLFPRLFLRPMADGTTVEIARGEIRRRLEMARSGRVKELLDEGVNGARDAAHRRDRADRRREADVGVTDTAVPDESAGRVSDARTVGLVDAMQFSRARQSLMSTGLATGPEALVGARQKHPGRVRPVGARGHVARGVEPYPTLDYSAEHLRGALGTGMPRLSAGHVDGWRFEHFRDLCLGDEENRRSRSFWLRFCVGWSRGPLHGRLAIFAPIRW